jgi:hypothetical protein
MRLAASWQARRILPARWGQFHRSARGQPGPQLLSLFKRLELLPKPSFLCLPSTVSSKTLAGLLILQTSVRSTLMPPRQLSNNLINATQSLHVYSRVPEVRDARSSPGRRAPHRTAELRKAVVSNKHKRVGFGFPQRCRHYSSRESTHQI